MISLTEDKVAISPLRDPEKTPGGIIIPDVARERCDQGIIKYIGPKVKDIKPGDYVLFGGYDGTLIQLEDEGTLIIMRAPFIKCIIEVGVDPSVSGLYFRAKPEFDLRDRIREIISNYETNSESLNTDVVTEFIMGTINEHDSYFPATYEMAVDLISEMWSKHEISKTFRVNSKIWDREKESIIEDNDE